VIFPFAAHVTLGKPVQFRMDHGHEFLECRILSSPPSQEQIRDFSARAVRHPKPLDVRVQYIPRALRTKSAPFPVFAAFFRLSPMMQTVDLLTISRIMGLAVGISASGFPSPPHINVKIINKSEAPNEVIARAQQIVSKVFSVARIETRWQECPIPAYEPSRQPECSDSPIVICVVINTEASLRSARNALGVSLPSIGAGNRAGVFYSRIERVSDDPVVSLGASVAEVLAYVMAHEIGHLLLNSKMHSNRGIMRGVWTLVEFGAMRKARLFFSAAEAGAMRRAVLKRNHLVEH
jgi:hypothetical protein